VHACLVIPEQPREDFILGLADGCETLAVETFYFQRSKQSLAGRVIPAVALAAHGSGDAALQKQAAELTAGILAAAVTMEDMFCSSVGTAPQPGHLQCIDDQIAVHLRLHRPAHHAATEQVDDHGQKQPALMGWNVGDVAGPRPVWRGHGKVAIQQVGCDRQAMPAVGGGDTEAPLAAGVDTVLLHEPLHTLLADADALSMQFAPDARPAISSAIGRIHGTNMHQQCLSAQVTKPRDLQATNQVLVVARHTYPQHPTLHADRPHTPIASNQGVLHFCPLAKYAIAFPRMSRSIVTRANSARKRLISICSAVTFDRLSAPFSVPSRCVLTELNKVCSTRPNLLDAAAMLWPDPTSRTASCLNSSVYRARVALIIVFFFADCQLWDTFGGGKITPNRLALWILGPALALAYITISCLLVRQHRDAPRKAAAATSHPLWTRLFSSDHPTTIVCADSSLAILQDLTEHTVKLPSYLNSDYRIHVASPLGTTAEVVRDLAARRYTSIVDVGILTEFYQLPGIRPDRIQLRYSRDVRPDDLRAGSVVLLGAQQSDPWVGLFESHMNFVFRDRSKLHNTPPER